MFLKKLIWFSLCLLLFLTYSGSSYAVQYHITDHLGSVRAVLNQSMTVLEQNDTRKFDSQWMFSLYNVYGRKNIYSLYVKQDMNITESHAYKMYLYRIVPTISYKIKF